MKNPLARLAALFAAVLFVSFSAFAQQTATPQPQVNCNGPKVVTLPVSFDDMDIFRVTPILGVAAATDGVCTAFELKVESVQTTGYILILPKAATPLSGWYLGNDKSVPYSRLIWVDQNFFSLFVPNRSGALYSAPIPGDGINRRIVVPNEVLGTNGNNLIDFVFIPYRYYFDGKGNITNVEQGVVFPKQGYARIPATFTMESLANPDSDGCINVMDMGNALVNLGFRVSSFPLQYIWTRGGKDVSAELNGVSVNLQAKNPDGSTSIVRALSLPLSGLGPVTEFTVQAATSAGVAKQTFKVCKVLVQ